MSAIRSLMSVIQALVIVFPLVTSARASATVVTAIDEFIITRSGVPESPLSVYDGRRVFYRDSFNDGLTPTSGGEFFTGATGIYSVVGNYPASAESASRLIIESSRGSDFTNAAGGRRLLQSSVLPTDADPTTAAGMKAAFHTFAVYGLFDLVIPPVAADGYGIQLNDSSPAGTTESIDLFVNREANGILVVRLQEQDFVDDVIDTISALQLSIPVGADQIELQLERGDLLTSEIAASFRFWSGGAAVSSFTMLGTGEIFTRNDWVRGGFFAVQAVPVPEPDTLALVAPLAAWLGYMVWSRRRGKQ